MIFPLWARAIAIATLIAAIVFGVHWYNSRQQDIGYQRAVAEYNVKLADAQNAAMFTERELTKKLNEAQNARIESEKRAATLKRDAYAESGRLRDTIADLRNRLSDSTAETIRAYADAGLRLLGACQAEYLRVAEAARGHQADAMMFEEAWPK